MNTLRYADRVKELKTDKALKEKSDALMLPRQAAKTIKYDYKKPSTSPATNLTGLAAIHNNIDSANKMMKYTSTKIHSDNFQGQIESKVNSDAKGPNRIQKMTNMRKAKSNVYGGTENVGLQPNKIYQALKAKNPANIPKIGIPAPTNTKKINALNPKPTSIPKPLPSPKQGGGSNLQSHENNLRFVNNNSRPDENEYN